MSKYVELYNKSKDIKKKYPKGTVIEAIEIDDVNAPPKGTRGVVDCVDDIGTIFVNWDEPGYVKGVVVIDNVDKIKIVNKKERM